MHAIAKLKLYARGLLPRTAARFRPRNKPGVYRPEAISHTRLAGTFCGVVAAGINCEAFVRIDELELSQQVAVALESIFLKYRQGLAQTAEERELGRALDIIASTHLEA